MFPIILFVINSATGRRRDIKIPLSQSAQHAEEFNIVSNDHGRTQKCNFCVSVCKTNFTDHHTPNTVHRFRDSVMVCQMHDCYCTISSKCFEHFHPLPSRFWLDPISRSRCRMYVILFNGRQKTSANTPTRAAYDLKKTYKPKNR